MNVQPIDTPTFDGQQIFGDLPSFEVEQLVHGRPLDVDLFLGFTPGTTLHGADPSGGRLFGIIGALIAPSPAAVAALRAAILSFAEITATFGTPTGLPFPGDFQQWPSCYFVPAESVPSAGGITSIDGSMYSLT